VITVYTVTQKVNHYINFYNFITSIRLSLADFRNHFTSSPITKFAIVVEKSLKIGQFLLRDATL